jgi:hypothetical protein
MSLCLFEFVFCICVCVYLCLSEYVLSWKFGVNVMFLYYCCFKKKLNHSCIICLCLLWFMCNMFCVSMFYVSIYNILIGFLRCFLRARWRIKQWKNCLELRTIEHDRKKNHYDSLLG